MSNYVWVPIVLAMFIIIPASVICFLRAIRWVYGRATGKHKIEEVERELSRNEYLKPDWVTYKKFLMRDPPPNMLLLYESSLIVSNPIVMVKGDEYYLKPLHDSYGLVDGMWILGQNELGEPIFLQ